MALCNPESRVRAGEGAYLVEEYIFSVPALGRKVLEIPILADAVLLTQLLPELTANCLTYPSVH